MNIMKIMKTQKKSLALMLAVLTNQLIMASGGSGTGATAITSQIDLWKADIKLVLDSVVFVFVIVGGFIIFMQYMQGNEQAQKNFVKFMIGLGIFAIIELIAGFFLP